MLKTFSQLLGDDVTILHRYLAMAVVYAVFCGLSLIMLALILSQLMLANLDQMALWLILLFFAIILCWCLRRVVEQMGIAVGIAVLENARLRLGHHAASLPVGWFTQQNTTQFNHLVTQGMMSVAQLPAHVFTPVISSVITPLVIVIALLCIHGVFGLIALVALPLIVLVFRLTSQIARFTDERYQQSFAETSQRMVEFAQAQSVLRAFNGEGRSTRFIHQAVDQQRHFGLKLILMSSLSAVLNSWAIQIVFAVFLIVTVFWLNIHSANQLLLADIVNITVSLLLVCRFIDTLLEVASYSEVLRSAGSQLEAIQQIFNAKALAQVEISKSPNDASIEFKNVQFRYAEDEPDVLKGVDLYIPSGSMMALIGASGSGKTTLAKLVARFFDVNQGQVLLGGVDVKQLRYEQLTTQISQIFQDNYLFSGSIAQNIRMGKANATDDQVMQAVQQAGITEMLARLPDGLESMVGEGGVRLSGGERQRITIARALIKDAPILLVDEATAALDAENQAIICELLNRLRGQKTILVIAHQLSTIAAADHIAVLEKGRVIEQGTPAQLRLLHGHYARYLAQGQAVKGWRLGKNLQVGEHA